MPKKSCIRKPILMALMLPLWLPLAGQFQIRGTITETESHSALPGVNVVIPELSIGAVSDENGTYQITGIPAGEFIIRYSYVGYQTINKKVFIRGDELQVDLEMQEEVIAGEEVVISGNFTSTQHDNTIAISTMGISQINSSSEPSLVGSITGIPGVSLISKGPGVVTPVIRGLSLNNILVLNNGVSMQNYQFSADHPYLIDENGVDRVEVIKGPASLIYGSDAVGGVINLIPRPVEQEGSIKGDYTLNYYSNTIGIKSTLGIQGNQRGFVWGLRGGVNSHKDYLQGDNEFAPNTRFNSYNIKADAGLIRSRGIFRVFYSHNSSRFGMAVEPAIAEITGNGRSNDIWYQDLTDHLVTSQNKLFLGTVKLDFDFSYQHNLRKLFGDSHDEDFNLVNMTLRTGSYRIRATHSINEAARYIVGVQGMVQVNSNSDAPERVLPDATVNDLSVYGLFQYDFSSVKLEAGLRYSYRGIDVPFQEASEGHGHGDDEGHEEEEEEEAYIQYDGQFDNLSASLGMTVKLNEMNLFRVNLASAFRSPNLAELTQQGRHGVRYEEGNPDLDVQQNLEFDIGYHLHTRHTSLDVSVFYNYIFDYIYLAPTADTAEDGDRIFRYSQDNAILFGGEVSLHIHPHPLDWLHLMLTYSQVVGQYAGGGNLPMIPANELFLELRLEKKKWKGLRDIYFEGGADFVFAQDNPSRFETSTSAYTLVNLGFGFDIQRRSSRISFYIKANNLLNTDYYDHLSTLKDVGIYNMGRNVMIGVNLPFHLKN